MVEDEHLDLETLVRFGDRALGREETFDAGWHLFLCAECRKLLLEAGPEAEALFETMFGGARFVHPEGAYGDVTRRVAERLREAGLEIERERRAAPARWAELIKHPPQRRALMVANAERFQSFGLAEYLLVSCRRDWGEDPGRAEELAELALAVIHQLDRRLHGTALLNDLKAEAWAYIANCRRIRSDLQSVSEAFDIAEDYHSRGTGDPAEEAALLDLKASYLRDQRRFDDAARTLERVIANYRTAGDAHHEGRALLKRGKLLREMGDLPAAVRTVERAASLIDPVREPRTALGLKTNLVLYLAEDGRAEEAEAHLPEVRRLAAEIGTRLDRLRFLWTEGLVLSRLGRTELAEQALLQAMRGFAEAGVGFDAALVALDLAGLYLDQERTAEARDLARQMVPLFEARGVHREALAALGVFHRAVEQESATLELVERLAIYLRRAARNPALRFEPPD